jgi:hypothetical protein
VTSEFRMTGVAGKPSSTAFEPDGDDIILAVIMGTARFGVDGNA